MPALNRYTVLPALVVGTGSWAFGFGLAVFVTSIGQPGFYLYFKLDPASDYCARILGAINALFYLGLAAGCLVEGWLADVVGRKKAFYIASTAALVGAALVAGSTHIAMLVVVRLIHGFGLGMVVCLVPLYLTEIAPPHRRGFLSGFTTLGAGLGYVTSAFVGVACYSAKNLTLQWRLPLSLACVGPLVLLATIPFIPESPRFLTLIGKNNEAWNVVKKIHHDPTDNEDTAARAEFTQIVRQVEFDKSMKSGYLEMFKKPSWRRRSILAIFLQFAAQSTGLLGIANYLVLILMQLGLTGVMPLVVYGLFTLIGTLFVFLAIAFVDRVGRRTMFLIGFPSLAILLLIEALLQRQYLGTSRGGESTPSSPRASPGRRRF